MLTDFAYPFCFASLWGYACLAHMATIVAAIYDHELDNIIAPLVPSVRNGGFIRQGNMP